MTPDLKFDEQGDDISITWRQSTFGTFLTCPERLRSKTEDETPTDAMVLGTALHRGIEQDLLNHSGGAFVPMREAASVTLERLWEDGVRQVDKGLEDSHRMLANMLDAWADSETREDLTCLATQGLVEVEQKFAFPVWRGQLGFKHLTINVEGQVDAVASFPDGKVILDWKTSGSRYSEWEYQRWAKQPTFYTLAHPGAVFRYVVFEKRLTMAPPPQVFDVQRTSDDHEFLIQQLLSATEYVLDNLHADRWIMRDEHAFCSAKWCGNWSKCKGRVTSGEGDR